MKDRPRPIMEHLTELKKRLFRAAVVGIAFTIVALVFNQYIFDVLERPAGNALNPELGGKLAQQDVTEAWSAIAKVGIIVGLSASLPFFLYQIVAFVRPALKPAERKWLYVLIPAGMLSFAAGATFGYFVLLPPAIKFLLNVGSSFSTPLIGITSYINLILALMFWMGVVFELPLVMFFLGWLGILKGRWVAKQRKWALMLAFVLGAIITPTADPLNQSLVAGPIIVMYEVGHWLVRIAEWQRSRRKARQTAAAA
jgi:sec-independent protein translocase protein TatC